MYLKYSALVIYLLVPLICAAEFDLDKKAKKCDVLECPAGTKACERKDDTSEDKKHIVKVIKCLDDEDEVLKEKTFTEDNPYGPYTNFHFYSYSKVVSYQITENTDSEVQSVSDNMNRKESSEGTAGEVEDLNNV